MIYYFRFDKLEYRRAHNHWLLLAIKIEDRDNDYQYVYNPNTTDEYFEHNKLYYRDEAARLGGCYSLFV